MNPGLFLVILVGALLMLAFYFAFEVMVFRLSCRMARVPRPGLLRSFGIVLVGIFAVSAAEALLGAAIREAYEAGGYPFWEAGFVALFLFLPVHMIVVSTVHAKMLGLKLGDGLAVWFIEKVIKLGLFAIGAGLVGLLILPHSVQPLIRYFATCARGLEPLLAGELRPLGASEIVLGRGGVAFSGPVEVLYRASLWLRTAVRVLRPILEADVRSPDELYDSVRTLNWADFLTPDHTLAVDCNVRDSAITHSQYAARRVKDAICDQFRERTGVRPSVDVEHPSIGLNLHIFRDHAVLSLDSSWDSLHKRGYRPIQTRAPLNEALASGLLLHLGYDGAYPLVDWMCGSGTFLVEGAWIAQRRPPGLTRKWFSFYGWPDFDPGLWAAIRDDARRGVISKPSFAPYGSDERSDAVELAQANAKAAGVGHLVNVQKLELGAARPNFGEIPGLLICNPPYGERLGEEEELIPLYRRMAEIFAEHWQGLAARSVHLEQFSRQANPFARDPLDSFLQRWPRLQALGVRRMSEVTQLLEAAASGDAKAARDILPLVYDELRKLAAHKLASENAGQTLQPTALVHEAYLRLVGGTDGPAWNHRGHFFAAAAEAMRRILVDAARRKKSLKRGGDRLRADIEMAEIGEDEGDLLVIDEALEKLATVDVQAAELVKLRYFAGFTMPEAAMALNLSERTAARLWAYARAWLRREIEKIE